jgi:hypothetical protein
MTSSFAGFDSQPAYSTTPTPPYQTHDNVVCFADESEISVGDIKNELLDENNQNRNAEVPERADELLGKEERNLHQDCVVRKSNQHQSIQSKPASAITLNNYDYFGQDEISPSEPTAIQKNLEEMRFYKNSAKDDDEGYRNN